MIYSNVIVGLHRLQDEREDGTHGPKGGNLAEYLPHQKAYDLI